MWSIGSSEQGGNFWHLLIIELRSNNSFCLPNLSLQQFMMSQKEKWISSSLTYSIPKFQQYSDRIVSFQLWVVVFCFVSFTCHDFECFVSNSWQSTQFDNEPCHAFFIFLWGILTFIKVSICVVCEHLNTNQQKQVCACFHKHSNIIAMQEYFIPSLFGFIRSRSNKFQQLWNYLNKKVNLTVRGGCKRAKHESVHQFRYPRLKPFYLPVIAGYNGNLGIFSHTRFGLLNSIFPYWAHVNSICHCKKITALKCSTPWSICCMLLHKRWHMFAAAAHPLRTASCTLIITIPMTSTLNILWPTCDPLWDYVKHL